MDQGARFPRVAEKAGHYESFYIKAARPGGGLGIWIRHTVHKRPGAPPKGSIWFTLFDREADGPRATKITVPAAELSTPAGTVPAAELSAPAGAWIRVAGAEIGPGRAAGSVETDALRAEWDLAFSGDDEPCKYLPSDRLYETRLPKTKFVAPYPSASYSGRLSVDGEEIALEGWPGMVGHNWGSEHAERWVWLEGTALDGGDAWFDAGAARIRIGPWTTPWIPSGMLFFDGRRHRLGGPARIRSAKVTESPTSCAFEIPGDGLVVRGRVSAPAKDFVGWVYADPKGPEHNTVNCSVSDLELTVEREGEAPRELRLAGAAAYEFGMRETDHGIPIQPYPDG